MRYLILSTLLVLGHLAATAQSQSVIDKLLDSLSQTSNSRNLSTTMQAARLISYGKTVLPLLAIRFSDQSPTNVYSSCQNTKLVKGEIAIIIADRIESMPYALLTGIQNCTMTFCDNNPNMVEYYVDAIRRKGATAFEKGYQAWLKSSDRKSWSD